MRPEPHTATCPTHAWLLAATLLGACSSPERAASPAADQDPDSGGDTGAAGSGAAAGSAAPATAGRAGADDLPGSVGVATGNSDAGATDPLEPDPELTLVEEPGERSWQCSAVRGLEALGISPWIGGELLATSQGLHLVRTEGSARGDGSFAPERLLVSSIGMDGVLGSPSVLGNGPGLTYSLPAVRDHAGQPRLVYSVASGSTELRLEQVDLADDGTPDGAPIQLPVDVATYAFPLPLEDGYLFVGRIYDPLRTDVGRIWTQKLDASGAPVGDEQTLMEASPQQRMAELAAQIVPTDGGFVAVYSWFAADANSVDITHYRHRVQLLDQDGGPLGTGYELDPSVGSHVEGSPTFMVHDGQTLIAWTEAERMPDPNSPMGWSGAPLWSVIRVARLDPSGTPIAPRTLAPADGPRSGAPYWVDLHADEVGLGWYETDVTATGCLECTATGSNHFAVLASDLQSAASEVVSFNAGEDTNFSASSGARFGDDILVLGDLDHSFSRDAASGTLHCTH